MQLGQAAAVYQSAGPVQPRLLVFRAFAATIKGDAAVIPRPTDILRVARQDATFQLFGNAPDVVGRLNLGVQVLKANGFELRLEYDLTAGGGYVSQVPSARFSVRF